MTPFKFGRNAFIWFGKNELSRKCLITFMILMFVIVLWYYIQMETLKTEIEFEKELKLPDVRLTSAEKFLIETSTCRIPNDDPFNKDIQKFYRYEQFLPCSNKPLLSYIEKKSSTVTLHINESLLDVYSFFKLTCCYSVVTRAANQDEEIRFSECVPFEKSVNITEFIVLVQCSNFINSQVYANVHAIVTPKEVKTKLEKKPETPGVLFVGIDSISKMNLVRTMPKTYNFLESSDFINLKGYTKIADNTFPNLMAILTGRTWTQLEEYCKTQKNQMNNCDIIWDKFNSLGYVTAYAEDETTIGTFNYNRIGFGPKPVDFYFRPYLIAAEQLPSLKRFKMHVCSGPENSGHRIMNAVKDFLYSFENHPKFGLFWMNTFSHDNVNFPSSMDESIESFLREIYPKLGNTIFVFFSDHGFRFGDIRYTHTGYLEERLPFIYIHLPKSFKENRPLEYKHFMTNSKRLTTPFDLYMTLQEILSFANHSHKPQASEACPKCHSLFSEIAENRTCSDAAIAEHWCVCSGHSYINPSDKLVTDGADFLLAELNLLITSSTETKDKCSLYFLKKIVSSGISEAYFNDRNQSVSSLLLMIETRPPAMFEATLEISQNSFRLLGDISRTNRYGSNSKCIKSALAKYCYCDGLITSVKSAICNVIHCI